MKNTSPYSSHIKILEKIIELKKPDSILEFGPGEYSTKLFLENCSDVISIEMNSQKWFEKTKHAGSIFCPGQDEFKKIESINKRFDLIFVDGHADSRHIQTNWSIQHSDIVIMHDTEENLYKWNLVEIPEGWKQLDIVSYRPWTSVLSKDLELIDKIKFYFNCVLDDKYFISDPSRDAIIWVTKLGPTSFSKYNPEWRAHLELQKYGLDSRWLCYFPKSDAHLDAELTKNTRIIEMDKLCQL